MAKPKRRTFSTEYKIRILDEADSASAVPGGIGALLRREGLYSSHLTSWRRERANGIFQALKPRQRGHKSERDPLVEENEKLHRQVGQLTEKLRKAEIIIDVQKKSGGAVGPSDSGSRPGRELLMAAVTELATTAGIQAACQALALPRASFYRKLRPYSSASPVSRRPSARALGPQEKETVLACLHEERFQDRSLAAVYATLLDEGKYLCSIRACIVCSRSAGSPASAATS